MKPSKRLLFMLSLLLCVPSAGGQEIDSDFVRKLEQRERRRLVKQARTGEEDARRMAYSYFAREISKGDSAAQITAKLTPPWTPINTNKFLREAYFSQSVPWTNRAHVQEWRSESLSKHRWPMILFALFSDARKTNLVDALIYDGGPGVHPLVDGPYNRKVLAIKPGDTMDKVFEQLGRRDCEYFKDKAGKWRVRVLYPTCDGRFIIYEAEAATGIILEVWDGTI